MSIKIALAGNPNSGKTSLFNDLTGSSQYVGNWPGVTVDKKEGLLLADQDVILLDLPGIYSLSPYTMEEIIARNYLVSEQPDAIINIVDASNIERNLYLTSQLLELGIPMIVALNMIDIVRKNGDTINMHKLSTALGCELIETSAVKGEGSKLLAEKAAVLAKEARKTEQPHVFQGSVEHALAHIEETIEARVDPQLLRFFAIKVFERDPRILDQIALSAEERKHIEEHIVDCEKELDDDAESIIIDQRYKFVERIIEHSVVKGQAKGSLSPSDKIDRIVTNRYLALPIFAVVMLLVYYLAVTTIGSIVTDWTNDVLFGSWIIPGLSGLFDSLQVAPWLNGLVLEGIVGGVGSVIGFLPQMIVLFLLLSILEDVGYMTRVAFIMDRVFRKFGLSGKSFIPMLIGSGCSVPGITASRTIESEQERRMTIMTTSFIPCGAKLPIIALLAGTIFGGAWWVSPLAYFVGVAAVVISGVMLKKTKLFSGKTSPFVLELPTYHFPTITNIVRVTTERALDFVRRAGTIILLASVAIWFLSSFGFDGGRFGMVRAQDRSVLAYFGRTIDVIFVPLGFGQWQMVVATLMGLLAKEQVVGTLGVLYGVSGNALELVEAGRFSGLSNLSQHITALSAFSFLVFNLLCAPCFAAMGAIQKEMGSPRWTAFALAYLTGFAYVIALIINQFGLFIMGGVFTLWTGIALLMFVIILYFLFRKNPYGASNNPQFNLKTSKEMSK